MLRSALGNNRLKGKEPWFWSLLRNNGLTTKQGSPSLQTGRARVGYASTGVEGTKVFCWPKPREASRSVRMKKAGTNLMIKFWELLDILDCRTVHIFSRITWNYKPWDLDSHLGSLQAQGFRSIVWLLLQGAADCQLNFLRAVSSLEDGYPKPLTKRETKTRQWSGGHESKRGSVPGPPVMNTMLIAEDRGWADLHVVPLFSHSLQRVNSRYTFL